MSNLSSTSAPGLLRIGLAQIRQTADFATNREILLRAFLEAVDAGVQILCTPETHTVGYRVDCATPEQPIPVRELEALHNEMATLCKEHRIALILGTEIPGAPGEKPFNSALVINEEGKILGTHHKTRLTPLDALAYQPGSTFETYQLWGETIGIVICFEGFRFPETTKAVVAQGARIVFHPQNNTTRPNDWKIPVHHAMITTRAAENTIFFASCNACWPDHQNCSSMIVAPDGQIVDQAPLHEEKLLVADIDPTQATRAMFLFDREGCGDMLFGNSVGHQEFAQAGPMRAASPS